MSLLDIRLFGGFQLSCDSKPSHDLYQARQQNLLAYLLLHQENPQPRRQIAFAFWPETNEKQALTNLRQLFHHLRNNFLEHASYIASTNRTLQWEPQAAFRLDVDDFASCLTEAQNSDSLEQRSTLLEEAVGLYQGPLFPDCYDEWILPIREGLHQQFIDALTQLIQLTEEAGKFTKAIGFAQRLLQHDPLHESAHRQLMQLYLQHGDRAAAMRIYHDCATLLRNELGVEPSAETAAVYDRLLLDGRLLFDGRLLSDDEQPTHEALIREAESSDLIGRIGEWHQLRAAWGDAAARRAQLFVVAGEAGIGKTRLAEELFIQNGRHGLSAIRTRSYAAAGDLAYGPIAEWLRSEMLKPLWHHLGETWLSEIARIVPEILTEQPTLPKPEPLTERWQRKRLFEALAHAFCAHTAPLLLVLDDLQWCDSDTLEFLHFLLRHEPAKPLLIVGTVRPEEVDKEHPLTDLLLNLRSDGLVNEIELEPLNEEATAALANQTATYDLEPDEQRSVLSATAGNPLYIVETVRSQSYLPLQNADNTLAVPNLAERQSLIPPRVYATIQRRLNALSPVARELAAVAAVIGRAFSFDLLSAVSEYAGSAVVRGLDELWQRRLVREQGVSEYDFSHDRIRDVAYGEIGVVGKRALHGRVAEGMVIFFINDVDSVSSQVAFHFERAGNVERAVIHYQRSAGFELNLYSEYTAIPHLRRAIELSLEMPNSAEVNDRLFDLYGDLHGCLVSTHGFCAPMTKEALDRKREIAQILNDEHKGLASLLPYSAYFATYADFEKCQVVDVQAMQIAQRLKDERAILTLCDHIAHCNLHLGKLDESIDFYEQGLIRLRKRWIDDVYTNGYFTSKLAETLWVRGFPERAQRLTEATYAINIELGHVQAYVHYYEFMMYTFQRLGDIEKVVAICQKTLDVCRSYDIPDFRPLYTIFLSWTQCTKRSGANQIELILNAIDELDEIHDLYYRPYLLSLLAELYARDHQYAIALRTIENALCIAQTTHDVIWNAELHRLKGQFQQALKIDLSQTEICFRKAITIAQQQSAKSLELRATVSLARLWQEQGKRQEAHQILAEIYGWFTEGFDTKDLIEAKALLDELA